MLKLTRFERNYSSCTGRSSENIYSSSVGAQEKGKIGWNSENSPLPLNANVFFVQVFFNLTLFMTKLRVLYFPDFTDISNVLKFWDLEINIITAKPEKYYNIVDCMGCRILGQNDTQPRFLRSSDPSRVKRLSVFVKKTDIIFLLWIHRYLTKHKPFFYRLRHFTQSV
jgi:hypothetical protein